MQNGESVCNCREIDIIPDARHHAIRETVVKGAGAEALL
jgi:hypothetical protein